MLLTVFIVVVQNAVGLVLALGVHTMIRSRLRAAGDLLRARRVSPVMIAFLWKYIYNPQPDAGLNAMLGFSGWTSCSRTGSATRAWRCGRSG